MMSEEKAILCHDDILWLQGTVNLVTAAQRSGIKKIVLVSSIGVDDTFFPLNLFFGVRPSDIAELQLTEPCKSVKANALCS